MNNKTMNYAKLAAAVNGPNERTNHRQMFRSVHWRSAQTKGSILSPKGIQCNNK